MQNTETKSKQLEKAIKEMEQAKARLAEAKAKESERLRKEDTLILRHLLETIFMTMLDLKERCSISI